MRAGGGEGGCPGWDEYLSPTRCRRWRAAPGVYQENTSQEFVEIKREGSGGGGRGGCCRDGGKHLIPIQFGRYRAAPGVYKVVARTFEIEREISGGVGGDSFFACLRYLTIEHASCRGFQRLQVFTQQGLYVGMQRRVSQRGGGGSKTPGA